MWLKISGGPDRMLLTRLVEPFNVETETSDKNCPTPRLLGAATRPCYNCPATETRSRTRRFPLGRKLPLSRAWDRENVFS
jgi:hypothetical protein